jgi:hypothetical protein
MVKKDAKAIFPWLEFFENVRSESAWNESRSGNLERDIRFD